MCRVCFPLVSPLFRLDLVKTRFQINTGVNPPVFTYMLDVIKTEGFFRFYRGLGAELVGMIPKSSAMYASYELFRRVFDDAVPHFGSENSVARTSLVSFLAGAVSGVPEAIVVTPPQVVKVRLQSKDFVGKYANTIDCAQKIIREEGLLKMMTGVQPTMIRNSVWNAFYFGSMQYLKIVSNAVFPSNRTFIVDRLETLCTGFVGAVFATCFNAPFDVVKSRIQSQVRVSPSDPLKYTSTFQTLSLILKDEGIAACYKGFQPKAIRMGLGGGVAMLTFELVCHSFTPKP